MNRRQLLRNAALTSVGGSLGVGCASFRQTFSGSAAPGAAPASGVVSRQPWADPVFGRLARVNVSLEREIRTIVGLRPFRATGFRVEVEKLDDKLVVHNYGHGGGGITLSWGSAHLAMEEGLRATSDSALSAPWGGGSDSVGQVVGAGRSCAVVGCGVLGLSTAILMQRQGWRVTIFAKDLPPHTTSNVAGGLWAPYAVSDPGRTTAEYDEQFLRASRLAHRYFQDLAGDHYGVRWVRDFYVSSNPVPQPFFAPGIEHLFPEMRALRTDEHPFPMEHALGYKTMLIEPHTYLPALMRDFRTAGGGIVVREFGDRGELAALPEPLIFNCTGLGAKALFDDDEMYPIKGQLTFLLPQPEVDYAVGSGDLYMFPRSDGILLGGTHERGEWSMEPDPVAKQRILAGHRQLFGWDPVTPAPVTSNAVPGRPAGF